MVATLLKDLKYKLKVYKKDYTLTVIILSIGLLVFAGLNSVSNSMKTSFENNYKNMNIMDVQIKSDVAFIQADEMTIKNIDGVDGISMVKSLESMATINNKKVKVNLKSINKLRNAKDNNYINRLTLLRGKYPSTLNEGLVDEAFYKKYNISLNDLIILTPNKSDDLRAKKVKVVGVIKESFKDFDNDQNHIYLEENEFGFDTYNDVYLTLNKNNKELKSEIEKIVKENKEKQIKDKEDDIKNEEDALNELYSSSLPQDSLNGEIEKITSSINTNKSELEILKKSNTSINFKEDIPSFYQYNMQASTIKKLISLFTWLILILSSVFSLAITINIMDFEKKEIGVLKALGKSNLSIKIKYMIGSLYTSTLSIIIGIVLYKILPKIIGGFYEKYYSIPISFIKLSKNAFLSSGIFILLFNLLGTIITYSVLMNKPIRKLINNESVKDKFTFNIFGFKLNIKTILLFTLVLFLSMFITGFSNVNTSINKIINKQYNNVDKYDIIINLDKNKSLNLNDKDYSKLVKYSLKASSEIITVKKNKLELNTYLIVPENESKIQKLVEIKTKLPDDGVIISSNLAKKLNLKKGNEISIKINGKYNKLKIKGIYKNYINNYVYISPKLYKKISSNDITYNQIFVIGKRDINKLQEKLLSNDDVSYITLKEGLKTNYSNMLIPLSLTIEVLIIITLIISVIMYNIILKVHFDTYSKTLSIYKSLGIEDSKLINEIIFKYKKTILYAFIIGIIFGSILALSIASTIKNNLFTFNNGINITSYFISLVFITIFAFISFVAICKKMNELDIAYYVRNN